MIEVTSFAEMRGSTESQTDGREKIGGDPARGDCESAPNDSFDR